MSDRKIPALDKNSLVLTLQVTFVAFRACVVFVLCCWYIYSATNAAVAGVAGVRGLVVVVWMVLLPV